MQQSGYKSLFVFYFFTIKYFGTFMFCQSQFGVWPRPIKVKYCEKFKIFCFLFSRTTYGNNIFLNLFHNISLKAATSARVVKLECTNIFFIYFILKIEFIKLEAVRTQSTSGGSKKHDRNPFFQGFNIDRPNAEHLVCLF